MPLGAPVSGTALEGAAGRERGTWTLPLPRGQQRSLCRAAVDKPGLAGAGQGCSLGTQWSGLPKQVGTVPSRGIVGEAKGELGQC